MRHKDGRRTRQLMGLCCAGLMEKVGLEHGRGDAGTALSGEGSDWWKGDGLIKKDGSVDRRGWENHNPSERAISRPE